MRGSLSATAVISPGPCGAQRGPARAVLGAALPAVAVVRAPRTGAPACPGASYDISIPAERFAALLPCAQLVVGSLRKVPPAGQHLGTLERSGAGVNAAYRRVTGGGRRQRAGHTSEGCHRGRLPTHTLREHDGSTYVEA
jgi:hypothetical protein